ncbi:putative PemK-like protein [Candidatus Glomeribacter gigasporarum BEG34]|uniref:Putative PemK-like protein n=1 Tax=Candidatus Glomeribacter gigasporarum BEG34 TaxID=1070319 RepID=G2JA06_9BURK|nr:type II toxin-antitoxin system PemK/MazF family toxin [Candidatus Glomeribacter gigasporarum]CCD29603.1 putative PemK-like protein [Candidatus Glomeribacter gigasporarum BEG34]
MKRGDVSPSQGAKAITAVNRVRRLSFNRISFNALESVSVLPLTSDLEDAPVFRVVIEPTGRSGISKLSQAMVDKIMPVRKERIRDVIGALDRKTMIKIESAIILFYGIA